ncbi:MAG: hypothetical protein J6T98_07770 [Salinivirgaceae bacterium]|nr:hypothetical protein [Salinivirgaceae bacterium]
MRRLMVLPIVAVVFINSSCSQDKYRLADEIVVPKPAELMAAQKDRLYQLAGYNKNLLVYQLDLRQKDKRGYNSAEAAVKLYYDENKKKVVDTTTIKRQGRNVHRFLQTNDLTLYHGFYQVPSNCENKIIDDLDRGKYLQDYQDFWIELNGKGKKIKSVPEHYLDIDVYYNVCYTGDCMVMTDFVSEYLRSTIADSIITVYSVQNGDVTTKEIACVECVSPQIVKEQLFYGQKFYYLEGCDDYDWKVYRAPNFDLSKSELLGEYIEPLLVSPDGKYILGKKYFQGKAVAVILDVEAKKFDYLLGREYLRYGYFYSPAYKKFAFDTESHIIYINYPQEFPFNSIGEDAENKFTTDSEDAAFWGKYKYPELSDF